MRATAQIGRWLLAMALVLPYGAAAQTLVPTSNAAAAGAPVEITAEAGIDWDRNTRVIVARGGVVAKQGTAVLHSDTLTARYSDESGMRLDTLQADGSVRLEDQGRVITGDRAIYDVADAIVTVFGAPVRLQDPQGTLTATDRMTYDSRQGIATAEGNATATQQGRVLQAAKLTAHFGTSQGRQTLDRIDASGGVVITTATETARADSGTYTGATGVATLLGRVRITQGRNLLTGAAAEIDLNSGLSRITTPDGRDRVRILFYPKEKAVVPGG
jgi:lipopolysaccharide export system protein LptA